MRLLYKAGPMESLRKWFYKPKRDDRSLLAQFFFADDALNMVAAELDSFDGRKDPDRCTTLVNQLRHAQDRVLNITSQIMDQVLGDERVARGFRVKFPEDVLQDNLAGQLWFGAECLAAGSSIMNREEESAAMRPLAKALTRSLETVRSLLREQCLRPKNVALSQHDDMLHETLRIFDRLFAEFELCYVSAMVNVKTPHEFEAQQLICVLFSESLRRALKQGLLTQEQVDSYDPALMFAVPRLAIVSGLLFYSNGPLGIDRSAEEMSDMFRPFRTLLHKIKSLLYTLERRELMALERLLCSNEQVCSVTATRLANETSNIVLDNDYPDIGEFVNKFYADHVHCRDLYSQQSAIDQTITESDYLPDNIEVMTPILDGMRRLSELDEQAAPEFASHTSTDTASTETFQDKDRLDIKPRAETDLSGLRNLSTSGLMMFDPLVINAVSSENRQLPDNDLVTSLNEQVTEIADRLSSIVHSDVESIEHSMHSYSASDVPTVVEDLVSYGGPRNEQLACLPSTSHGFLIPNAISHEPVVLASLSHNNSTVFNPEDEINEGLDLPQIIPDNIDTEIVNTNISIANANLTSLLLTNEEYRNRFAERDSECDDDSFHSSKDVTVVSNKEDEEKVKFMLGYESEQESQVDSGVSTENTSLDRSPDADTSKEHFMKQNRVLKTPIAEEYKPENILENSFSECTDTNENSEVTVNINYVEQVDVDRNEAGSSNLVGETIRNDLDTSILDATRNPNDIRYLDCTSNIDDSRLNLEDTRINLDRTRIHEDDIETSRNVFETRTEASNDELNRIKDAVKALNKHKADHIRKVLERNGEIREPPSRDNSDIRELDSEKREPTRDISDRGEPNSETREPTKHNGDIRRPNSKERELARENSDRGESNSETREPARHTSDKREPKSEKREPNIERREPSSDKREPTRENADSSSSSSRQKKSGKSGSKSKRKRNKMWSPGIVLLDRAVQNQHNAVKLNLDHYVETGSALSECADDEQIAIALQAQELAARQQARGKFKSSEDLIHRLFVCIAGVADQLQTNFAADLRNILKSVFLMNQTPDKEESDLEPESDSVKESDPVAVPVGDGNKEAIEYEVTEDQIIQNGSSFDSVYSAEEVYADSNSNSSHSSSQCEQARIRCDTHNDTRDAEAPTTSETRRRKSIDSPREASDQPTSVEKLPEWIPDIAAPQCMRCAAHFTAFRRRHHCRNCGKVFCASCSSNSIPLPRYGQMKPVRVCEECFHTIATSCRRAVVSGR